MINKEASEVLKASSIQQMSFCKIVVNGKAFNVKEALDTAIKALEQEPCEDCISRQSIKRKLQEHHDFFVHIYNGFSNMPQNDKSRVDEISNCIAMVVNEPSVTPKEKTGKWIEGGYEDMYYVCSECDYKASEYWHKPFYKFCPNCGARMVSE